MGSPKGLGLLTLLGFCRVPVLFMAFNPSPNSFIRLQNLHLIFGYKFLHLFPLACWVEPLRRQLCQVPICKNNRALSIMLGIGSCPWNGSQFGTVINWPFPPSLPHLCPCITCKQDTFWVKGFVGELVFLSLYWKSCLATGSGHFKIHIFHC